MPFVNISLDSDPSTMDVEALDLNALRPFYGPKGQKFINRPAFNAEKGEMEMTAVPVEPGMLSHNVSTLMKDEWRALDTAVIKTAKPRLRAVADLVNAGLTFDLGEGLGITQLQWQTISDPNPAAMSMDGLARSDNDKVVYDLASLPIPIIHKDWQLNMRLLQSSRRMGTPMDTTLAEGAADQVARYSENLLINGSGGFSFGGATIYGYTTYDKRTQGSLTYQWANTAVTGAQIVTDVKKMVTAMSAKHLHGPFILYVPTNVGDRLDDDYVVDAAPGTKTIRKRLEEFEAIQSVRVLDYLAPDNALLVLMDRTTVRLVQWNQGVRTFSWPIEGGWSNKFKVATIMVPNLRCDFNGTSGIAHFKYTG